MTPYELFPFFAAYAIYAGLAIFFSLFIIAGFLGLATYDLWNIKEYPKAVKILLSAVLFFLPELGVVGWAIIWGRTRKFIFRFIAIVASGLYLLLQSGIFYVSTQDHDLASGLFSAFMMHFMWLPFILVGGVVSFFVFRAIFSSQNAPPTSPRQ